MDGNTARWSEADGRGRDDCAAFLARHGAYRDGQLPPAVHALHEAHAAACDACARYARVLDRGVGVLRQQPELVPSPDFAARLQHRIYHLEDGTLSPRRRYLPATMAAAMLAAVLVIPRLPDTGAAAGYDLQAHLHEEVFGTQSALWHTPPLPLAQSARNADVMPVALYTPVIVQPPRYRSAGAH